MQLKLGDTNLPKASLSAGSQATASVGTAVAGAAANLRRWLIRMAISTRNSPLRGLCEAVVIVAGGERRSAASPARRIAFTDLIGLGGRGELAGKGKTEQIAETEDISRVRFGAHFAEVRLRPATGEVRVGFAAGRIINPKTARSQFVGGIVWGIGMGLHEKAHVCSTTGRFVNHHLAEHHVPANADVPRLDAFFLEENDAPVDPLGVKWIGEIGTIGSASAIVNAVFHATGRRVRDLPITPDKLLRTASDGHPTEAFLRSPRFLTISGAALARWKRSLL